MNEVREVNKEGLHYAALEELKNRRVRAEQRRLEKLRSLDREAITAMMLNDPSSFDLKEQILLDDSYSSINSLDIHAENKATILKKAGSTRRNLPELELKAKNVAVAGSMLQTSN